MITVAKVMKTCDACPSQWEGTTDAGKVVYVRYRWGYLSISIGDTMTQAIRREGPENSVFEKEIGNGLDGFITYDELMEHTRGVISWPEFEEVYRYDLHS